MRTVERVPGPLDFRRSRRGRSVRRVPTSLGGLVVSRHRLDVGAGVMRGRKPHDRGEEGLPEGHAKRSRLIGGRIVGGAAAGRGVCPQV